MLQNGNRTKETIDWNKKTKKIGVMYVYFYLHSMYTFARLVVVCDELVFQKPWPRTLTIGRTFLNGVDDMVLQ